MYLLLLTHLALIETPHYIYAILLASTVGSSCGHVVVILRKHFKLLDETYNEISHYVNTQSIKLLF